MEHFISSKEWKGGGRGEGTFPFFTSADEQETGNKKMIRPRVSRSALFHTFFLYHLNPILETEQGRILHQGHRVNTRYVEGWRNGGGRRMVGETGRRRDLDPDHDHERDPDLDQAYENYRLSLPCATTNECLVLPNQFFNNVASHLAPRR